MIRTRRRRLERPEMTTSPSTESSQRIKNTTAKLLRGYGRISISQRRIKKISRSFKVTVLPRIVKITILVTGMEIIPNTQSKTSSNRM